MKNKNGNTVLSSLDKSHVSRILHTTLVCFAVKEEAAPFMRVIHNHPACSVIVTGMGKLNAESAVRSFFEQQKPNLVLTCGFAGGLDPELTLGTVVFEENQGGDLGTVLEKLCAKRVKFFCASRMIITPAEKRSLREKTGADAVEMESGSIRALCSERHIPCATVRVISDTAGEELPLDFNRFMAPDNSISYARLGLAVLKSPGKFPQMLSFHKRTTRVAEKLARVLKDVLQKHC
jgi:adenosylhomocysteine nucleosidase